MRNILRVPGFFRTIFSEPLGEENIRKNPGTSKIFPYCTRNCLITSLSWPKKYSAKFWTFPIMSVVFFCFFFSLLPVSNFFLFEIRMSNFRIFEHSKVRMSRKYSKIPKHFLKKLQKSQTLAASQCFCLALRLVTLCCLELNLYSEFIRVDHDSTGYERQTDKLCYGSFKFFTTFTMRWSGFVWIMSIVRSSKKILDILDIRLAEWS